ncbi:hypothetical protein EAH80_16450 [Mycobacterium hodleri]|uniref:Uncharacterized protein n=1 Tax=Mycolicibacterium hodleri TaxID=49897 RepID=A0A502E695_9MYCO|nr:hypothetical protein EAH80_16450 [Mycolicibacterium hodleri]
MRRGVVVESRRPATDDEIGMNASDSKTLFSASSRTKQRRACSSHGSMPHVVELRDAKISAIRE